MKVIESVMIVDNNPIDVFINTRAIQQSGLSSNVIAQQSARSAPNFLKESERNQQKLPELILLDIRMPDMNGFEFLDEFSNLSPCIKLM